MRAVPRGMSPTNPHSPLGMGRRTSKLKRATPRTMRMILSVDPMFFTLPSCDDRSRQICDASHKSRKHATLPFRAGKESNSESYSGRFMLPGYRVCRQPGQGLLWAWIEEPASALEASLQQALPQTPPSLQSPSWERLSWGTLFWEQLS